MSANRTGELLFHWQLPKLLPSYHDTANTLLCTSQLQLQHKLWLTRLEIICELLKLLNCPTEKHLDERKKFRWTMCGVDVEPLCSLSWGPPKAYFAWMTFFSGKIPLQGHLNLLFITRRTLSRTCSVLSSSQERSNSLSHAHLIIIKGLTLCTLSIFLSQGQNS